MTLHLSIGMVICMAGSYVLVRFVLYRDENVFHMMEHPEITELKREIKAWKHTEQGIATSYSAEEDIIHETINQKIAHLEQKLNRNLQMGTSQDNFMITLIELQKKVSLFSNIISICFYYYFIFIFSFPSAIRFC